MLKFYYSKGSSAIAALILLEEVGAAYEAVEVSIAKGEHRSEAFLRLNPKGRIPALQTAEGVLTENPAILEYIAATHPQADMVPHGAFAQAQARARSAYLCATVHVAFAHLKRGTRWADQASAIKDMQGKVAENLRDCAQLLERELPLSPWALGARYSFCDPYLFLLDGWLRAAGETLDPTPKLATHHEAVRARPATQRALALHAIARDP